VTGKVTRNRTLESAGANDQHKGHLRQVGEKVKMLSTNFESPADEEGRDLRDVVRCVKLRRRSEVCR